MPPPPPRTRLRRAITFVVAVLVVLEVTLQALSFIVWAQTPTPAAAAGNGKTILCVGDSWTQGMGSSDPDAHSYPAVLERALSRTAPTGGQRWRVVNAGLAGRNSRELLEMLPGQLKRYRPEFVYILVGQNDYWSRPAPLPDGVEESGGSERFRWRWRTLRFALWVAGKLGGAGQQAMAEPLPTGGEWTPVRPQHLAAYPVPDRPWARSKATQDTKRRGWDLSASGDKASAAKLFEEVISEQPGDPQARSALVALYAGMAERQRAVPHLAELHALWDARPGYFVGRCLAAALQAMGKYAECLPVSTRLARDYPESDEVWAQLSRARFKTNDLDGAMAAIDTAIAKHDDPRHYHWRGKFLQLQAKPEEALRTYINGYLKFNNADWLARRLRSDGVRGHETTFGDLVATTECTPEQRARLERIGQHTYSQSHVEVERVLAQHLERATALCQRHGARPILLTYPLPHDALAVHQRTAAEQSQRFLDVRAHFKPIIRERTWRALRATDGHCNDEGYEIMGQCVADDFVSMLRDS